MAVKQRKLFGQLLLHLLLSYIYYFTVNKQRRVLNG
jgi:hypothetical protein